MSSMTGRFTLCFRFLSSAFATHCLIARLVVSFVLWFRMADSKTGDSKARAVSAREKIREIELEMKANGFIKETSEETDRKRQDEADAEMRLLEKRRHEDGVKNEADRRKQEAIWAAEDLEFRAQERAKAADREKKFKKDLYVTLAGIWVAALTVGLLVYAFGESKPKANK